uniref:Myb-like, SWIRM and MPN domain-containing protein 1 n=1 Tax=Dendroctonus ponderosae TaxID=77166 RepID=A0AAR5PNB3_DENPD
MADEDEIDILGDDFNLPFDMNSDLLDKSGLMSQNSDLLKCDYTVHPQWLLDQPSANPDNWYKETPGAPTPEVSDSEDMSQVYISTENCITDESGWTDKEKTLLQKGMEIFGRSCVRLAQVIGSRTAAEVRYYFKNFYSCSATPFHAAGHSHSELSVLESLNFDILNSDQIPASIEEVIAVINAGAPTVGVQKPKASRRESSSSSSSATHDLTGKSTVLAAQPSTSTLINSQIFPKSSRPPRMRRRKRVKLKNKGKTEISQAAKVMLSREIVTGQGRSVPSYEGEEIVNIRNASDDSSDVSIDIEDVESSRSSQQPDRDWTAFTQSVNANLEDIKGKPSLEVAAQLESLEKPREEFVLDRDIVSDLEKYVHSDYFEGRPAKTPERYLKIRNYIVNSWKFSKPNYVYKTSMRLGLKNCGDVTCISRIHNFLEQIGAINFGCEQTKYERPLSRSLQLSESTKTKVRQPKSFSSREPTVLGPRQRVRKTFNKDGDGGCTMTHDDHGKVINTTIIKEEPAKRRTYQKRPIIKLIYCKPFPHCTLEKSVKISLSSLLLMDFHSHSCITEVMGLVGGAWDACTDDLHISCYEPCNSAASSSTHCDMCPISQAKAAENIHARNAQILGWFHSHPTFAPEPSQQDIDTQQLVQQWIGLGKPCVGVILSPFSMSAALIASPFRCWVVGNKLNCIDDLVPYRYSVEVVSDGFVLSDFLNCMRSIVIRNMKTVPKDERIPFLKPYFRDSAINHLDKFISSVNMHLAKCGGMSKSKCDAILEGIKDVIIKGS